MLKHIASKSEFDVEIQSGKVLVDFYADWCGPCKMLSPIVEEIAKEHPEINVLKVNVDEVPELASVYRVSAIPTLIAFENGKTLAVRMGYMPKESVLSLLNL